MKLHNSILENSIPPMGDIVLGTEYISTLRKWRKIQNYSELELKELQEKNLRNLLDHVQQNIPFYKKFVSGSGRLELKDLPVLTKPIIRVNIDSMLWHPARKHKLISEKSSGSSGIQGEVFVSRKEQSVFQAIQTLTWEWAGLLKGSG